MCEMNLLFLVWFSEIVLIIDFNLTSFVIRNLKWQITKSSALDAYHKLNWLYHSVIIIPAKGFGFYWELLNESVYCLRWWLFHIYLSTVCFLKLLEMVFYIYKLTQVYSNLFKSSITSSLVKSSITSLIFSLYLDLSIIEWGLLSSSNMIVNLTSPFSLISSHIPMLYY